MVPTVDQFKYIASLETRWADNDLFGHVNNVVYYSYFDTVANNFLMQEGGFKPHTDPVIGYVVNSSCNYYKGVAHPCRLRAGFRVEKLGNSSVTYGIALFTEAEDAAIAYGTFTHVFVDRATERPTPIPETIRSALAAHQHSN